MATELDASSHRLLCIFHFDTVLLNFQNLRSMIQTLNASQPSVAAYSQIQILCSYINITSRIQVIRITNVPKLQFEKVIFPGQRLLFESIPEAKLEIQLSELISKSIPCQQLS